MKISKFPIWVSFCIFIGFYSLGFAQDGKTEKDFSPGTFVFPKFSVVDLYTEPVFGGDVIETLNLGDQLEILKEENQWLFVKTTKQTTGWVSINWVTADYEEVKNYIEAKTRLEKERKIQNLEKEAESVPPSDIGQNLNIYEQLLKLAPENETYKSKVAYYEKMKADNFTLEVLSWHWSEESNYVTAEGEVKNLSNNRLESVEALVTWYTKEGDFITSDSSFIKINPLMPGQKSPFEVMTTYNPLMNNASLVFKFFGGSTIPTFRK